MTNKEAFDKFFDNSLFEDWSCEDCVRRNHLTPCRACDWWDKEYTGSIKTEIESIKEEKLLKIFISPSL